MFDKATFEKSFSAAIETLIASENVTKKELRTLSRTVLEAWHITGNVAYANRLLKALTPINKKAAIVFFKHFSGYSFDEALFEFTGKSKKRYDKAHALAMEFLADPHQNIWTWAERNIEVSPKAFDLKDFGKYITRSLEKAAGVGLTQADILKEVFKAGVNPECVIQVMDELGFEFDVEAEPQKIEDAPL